MENVNMQFTLSLLIIILGYVFKKIGLVKESDGEAVSRIIFNLTLPSLVISTFSTMKIETSLLLVPLISAVYGLVMAAVALVAFRKEKNKDKGMMSMLLPGFNIGLFAYPLVESIWGQQGLKYFGMFDMGNSVIVFGVCYIIASIYNHTDGAGVDYRMILKRAVSSIPFMTYIVTLALNLSGLSYPGIILDITKTLSRANLPLSLLLLGIYLSFSFEQEYWVRMVKVLALRYGIGITVGLVLYWTLPFEPIFRYTMLLGFTLPISMSVIPYSVQFDYDKRFVGTVNNITIVASFLLMWAVVALGVT